METGKTFACHDCNESQIAVEFGSTHNSVTIHYTSERLLLAEVSPVIAQLISLTMVLFISLLFTFHSFFFFVEKMCIFTSPFPLSVLLGLFIFLTLSRERWHYAVLIAPNRLFPSPQLQYLLAHLQYSHQNNWNPISQNNSVIILSTRLEKKKRRKIEPPHNWKLLSTHRLLRRPDFFFFLFFGRGDGELLDFLFTLNGPQKERKRGRAKSKARSRATKPETIHKRLL